MSAFARRALIGGLVPNPYLRETPFCQIVESSRRPEDKICGLSCLGPLGPAQAKISSILHRNDTAYSGITVAAGQLLGAIERSPPHQTGRQAPGGVR